MTLKGRQRQTVRAETRASKPSVPPSWLWAGVAALLLLSVYSGWQAERLRRDLVDLRAQSAATAEQRAMLEKERTDAQRAALILAEPSSVRVAMPQPAEKGAPLMRAYWHAQLGIVVAGTRIPVPVKNRILELWLFPKVPGRKPIPAGFGRPQPDGTFVLFIAAPAAPLGETKALAVTEEPAGGSPQPTTTPRWVGVIG